MRRTPDGKLLSPAAGEDSQTRLLSPPIHDQSMPATAGQSWGKSRTAGLHPSDAARPDTTGSNPTQPDEGSTCALALVLSTLFGCMDPLSQSLDDTSFSRLVQAAGLDDDLWVGNLLHRFVCRACKLDTGDLKHRMFVWMDQNTFPWTRRVLLECVLSMPLQQKHSFMPFLKGLEGWTPEMSKALLATRHISK